MNKKYKLLVFVISLLIVFSTYSLFINKNKKKIYIALGDSIAEGMNSYSQVDYGYTDYIKDYLKEKNILEFYTKLYSKSGYTTRDLKTDIENNKVVEVDNKKIYLKEILRESDLITLTIGANDLLRDFDLLNISSKLANVEENKRKVDQIAIEVKETIKLIKIYARNQIIVTGYYNPLPRNKDIKQEIDEIVKYYNNEIEEICEELNVTYIDIFEIFNNNEELLPNPIDIHPNKKGYEKIAKEIIKYIK